MDEVLKDGKRRRNLDGLRLPCDMSALCVSLAVIDESLAIPGSTVTVLWGEDPNSAQAAS